MLGIDDGERVGRLKKFFLYHSLGIHHICFLLPLLLLLYLKMSSETTFPRLYAAWVHQDPVEANLMYELARLRSSTCFPCRWPQSGRNVQWQGWISPWILQTLLCSVHHWSVGQQRRSHVHISGMDAMVVVEELASWWEGVGTWEQEGGLIRRMHGVWEQPALSEFVCVKSRWVNIRSPLYTQLWHIFPHDPWLSACSQLSDLSTLTIFIRD